MEINPFFKYLAGKCRFVAGKYYFSPKRGGDRFFAGAIVFHNFYVSYKLTNQALEKPKSTTGIGPMIGYKWIARERLVAEIGLISSYSTDDLFFLLPNLKLGYRF